MGGLPPPGGFWPISPALVAECGLAGDSALLWLCLPLQSWISSVRLQRLGAILFGFVPCTVHDTIHFAATYPLVLFKVERGLSLGRHDASKHATR